jgi:hypothetical protein
MIYVNISYTLEPQFTFQLLPYQYMQSGGIPLALPCFKYHGGASSSPTEGAEIQFCVTSCVPVFAKWLACKDCADFICLALNVLSV